MLALEYCQRQKEKKKLAESLRQERIYITEENEETFEGKMNFLQDLMEKLRPLVGLKSWDYIVLWKLSEDQRFLGWIDCCCAGSGENLQNGGDHELLFPVSSVLPCRDVETIGTRVLIPLPVGLVELFVDKQVTEDQRMTDFVTAQFSISMELQSMIDTRIAVDSSFSMSGNATYEIQSKQFLSNGTEQNDQASDLFHPPVSPATMMHNLNLQDDFSNNSPMNFMQQFNYTAENGLYHIDKGLLNPFMASAEEENINGFDQETDAILKPGQDNDNVCIIEPLAANKKRPGNDMDSTNRSDSASDCSNQNDEDDDVKHRRRNGKGPQAKNLMAERKRRKKLNERLYALRALVPTISKLDRASILGDAIKYVMDLQDQARELQNELEEHSNNDPDNNQSEVVHGNGVNTLGPKSEPGKPTKGCHNTGASGSNGTEVSKQNLDSDITSDKVQMEPQVEVAQLGANEFFVKVFCEHKSGGFVRLMEALNSLGLDVTNVNVTRNRPLVLNIFKVEKRDSEMIQADDVRDSLLELTRNPCTGWSEMAKTSENGHGMNYHHPQYHHHHAHLHSHQVKSHSHNHLHD
ncbi:hypothetical protein RJ639_013248 [Escallonia herrerae]|uniref:BHLH domain-containing protein n=1 Tax=Escallonia herrerae TaxID=1293975 RepID=A0AA88VI47_9ASTE|nr:hypothetical protein RJ639_013248 [Escallonia herrerae]